MSTENRADISDGVQDAAAYKKTKDNPPITIEELLRLKEACMSKIREEELYQVRNNAKLRAVYSTQSYDEFKDIVDAAHLKPINKKDKMDASTKNRLWNSAAKD